MPLIIIISIYASNSYIMITLLRLSLLKVSKRKLKENIKQREFILTNSWGCGKEVLWRKRSRRAQRWRKKELGKGNSRLGCWSTHRGGWAIGPGSTPPSFVLTPAAFPPVGVLLVPIASPAVVVAGRGVAGVVVAWRSMFPVPFPAVVLSTVTIAIVSVVWPAVWRAIVVAAKRRTAIYTTCLRSQR